MSADNDKRKQLLVRISDSLWKDISRWAEDDFRSVNGQIEWLLTECVKRHKKGAPLFRGDNGQQE
jgi:hypothetical protein